MSRSSDEEGVEGRESDAKGREDSGRRSKTCDQRLRSAAISKLHSCLLGGQPVVDEDEE